jgi:hypothetical protein
MVYLERAGVCGKRWHGEARILMIIWKNHKCDFSLSLISWTKFSLHHRPHGHNEMAQTDG